MVNSVLGFTLAHEFIHRHSNTERIAGYLLLLQNNYLHYGIEHIWGHHVYACTPEDPVTARMGESIYAFLPRAIKGTLLSALKIENKKLSRCTVKIPFLHNRVLIIRPVASCTNGGDIFYPGRIFSALFFITKRSFYMHAAHHRLPATLRVDAKQKSPGEL